MLFALPVEVHTECQVFAGLEEIDLFLQQQSIRAEVDVFLAGYQAFDNFADPRMHQRLAAWDRDHGRATFIDSAEAFFRAQVLLQDVGWVLNFATPRTRKIAAEQRFQHQDKRILLPPG